MVLPYGPLVCLHEPELFDLVSLVLRTAFQKNEGVERGGKKCNVYFQLFVKPAFKEEPYSSFLNAFFSVYEKGICRKTRSNYELTKEFLSGVMFFLIFSVRFGCSFWSATFFFSTYTSNPVVTRYYFVCHRLINKMLRTSAKFLCSRDRIMWKEFGVSLREKRFFKR